MHYTKYKSTYTLLYFTILDLSLTLSIICAASRKTNCHRSLHLQVPCCLQETARCSVFLPVTLRCLFAARSKRSRPLQHRPS